MKLSDEIYHKEYTANLKLIKRLELTTKVIITM